MTLLVTDTFTDADNTLLEAHTSDSGDTWSLHPFWSAGGHSAKITSNEVVLNTGSSPGYVSSKTPSGNQFTGKITGKVTDNTTNRGIGIILRVDNDANIDGYLLRTRGIDNIIGLYRYDNGAASLITSWPHTPTPNVSFSLSVTTDIDGNGDPTFEVFVDDVKQGSTFTDTNVNAKTTNNIGLWVVTTGASITSFESSEVLPDSITVTEFSNTILQREGTSKTITISGSYSGTPTTIEYRIKDSVTNSSISGHDWQTLDASPSGGAFSSTVSVDQRNGFNLIEVRFSNTPAIIDSQSNAWGVGLLAVISGQSNKARWFTDGTSETPNSLIRLYSSGSWSTFTTTGNGAIAFANKLAETLNIPIGLIYTAVSGTALRSEADSGSGYWMDTSDSSIYDDQKTVITAIGGSIEFFIFGQGERDARSGVVTYYGYYSSLVSFLNGQVRVDTTNGSTRDQLPIIISYLGRGLDVTDDDIHFEDIREAQRQVVSSDSSILGVTTLDHAMKDTIHYSDASYVIDGIRTAQAVLHLLGIAAYSQGALIEDINKVSPTILDVIISHENGSDFTPTTASGFSVFDDGIPVIISSTVKKNSYTYTLTLNSPITGVATVRYLYGAAPDISNGIVDNTTLTLPLQSMGLREIKKPVILIPKKAEFWQRKPDRLVEQKEKFKDSFFILPESNSIIDSEGEIFTQYSSSFSVINDGSENRVINVTESTDRYEKNIRPTGMRWGFLLRARYDSSSSVHDFIFDCNASTRSIFNFDNNGDGNISYNDGSTWKSLVANSSYADDYHNYFIYADSSTLKLFIDGNVINSITITPVSLSNEFALFNRTSNVGNPISTVAPSCKVSFIALFRESSIDYESARLLSESPYQFLKQKGTSVYYKKVFNETEVLGQLILSNLSQAQSFTNLDLIQQNTISSNNITQNQTEDNIALTQQNIVSSDNITQQQVTDTLNLIQQNTVTVNNIDTTTTLENVGLVQQNVLALNNINQLQLLENLSLITAGLLQVANLAQSETFDNLDLIGDGSLSVANIVQAQTVSALQLVQQNILSVNPVGQLESFGELSLTQQNTLILSNIFNSQGMDNLVLSSGLVLSVNNINQAVTIDQLTLLQQHLLTLQNISQTDSLDNIALTQQNIIVVNDLLHQHITDNLTIIDGTVKPDYKEKIYVINGDTPVYIVHSTNSNFIG